MSDGNQTDDQAKALLALRVALTNDGQNSAAQVDGTRRDVAEEFTDEELALLVEGRLPFARKQQLMQAVLDDDVLMRRWLSVSEASQGLAQPAAVESYRNNSSKGDQQTWWQQARLGWGAWVLSGATGACMLAVGWFAAGQYLQPLPGDAGADVAVTEPSYTPTFGGKGGKYGGSLHTAQHAETKPSASNSVSSSASSSAMLCADLVHPLSAKPGAMCVLSLVTKEHAAQGVWLWIGEGSQAGEPRGRQQLALLPQRHAISELLPSEDGKWLAVVSRSARYPRDSNAQTIALYRVADWFTRRDDAVSALHEIVDPAPDARVPLQWKNGELQIGSFYDFSKPSAVSTESKVWQWNPQTGELLAQ